MSVPAPALVLRSTRSVLVTVPFDVTVHVVATPEAARTAAQAVTPMPYAGSVIEGGWSSVELPRVLSVPDVEIGAVGCTPV
jgi:hypothetical protein